MAEVDLNSKIRGFLDSAARKGRSDNYAEALDELKAAEALDRSNPVIMYNLGVCYSRTGQYKMAGEYFTRLMAQPTTFVDIVKVKKLLAYCLIMQKEYSTAIHYLDECLAIAKRDTTAMNMKGYALDRTGEYARAVEIYKEILSIDPENYTAYNSMAYILLHTGADTALAMRYAKIALNAQPDNAAYLDTMGAIYMKKGQNDMAKKFFKKALSIQPDSVEIKEHISQLLKI